jgi:serine/threonine-protein kinase HipA
MVVSALTILELDEMHARYASYEDLCHTIRHRFTNPKATLAELFNRIVFNILSGNTDDHARNHAAFWDGEALDITPAYDMCPQGRSGQEASQAMLITGSDRSSRLATCIKAANQFLLTRDEAIASIEDQLGTIKRNWADICNEASLTQAEQSYFWGRQFLNPYAFNDLPADASTLSSLYRELR